MLLISSVVPPPILLSSIITSPGFEVAKNAFTASITNLFDDVFLSGIGVCTQIIPIFGSSDFVGAITRSKLLLVLQWRNSFFR